jgi:hypothetical protein
MRYVLPALPVSGPSGNRARRREAARLAQRQGAAGKTQRQDAAGCCGASASAKALCPKRATHCHSRLADASMPTKQQATELLQEF